MRTQQLTAARTQAMTTTTLQMSLQRLQRPSRVLRERACWSSLFLRTNRKGERRAMSEPIQITKRQTQRRTGRKHTSKLCTCDLGGILRCLHNSLMTSAAFSCKPNEMSKDVVTAKHCGARAGLRTTYLQIALRSMPSA
jgi:hypothetical protein